MKILAKTLGKGNTFGECFDLTLKNGEDCVILCRNSEYGWEPVSFLLPHQVYIKNIEADFKENVGNAYTTYAIFPINSNNYINVAKA